MVTRRLILAGIFILFVTKMYAQVNLQSGAATFSLPMFNWKDDKSRLYTTVSLSYNSGNGLKVTDVASSVGQGWNLVAGGVITRMQVGEPDDQQAYGTASASDRTKFPDGFLYGQIPVSQGCPGASLKYPIYSSRNQIYTQHNAISEDKQADYFSFQFNGKAGMFILDTTGICQPLGDSKMKITFQRVDMKGQGKRTTINSFQIHDVDGLIYKFTQHSLTKILRTEYCDQALTNIQAQPKEFKGGRVYYQKGFDVGPTGGTWVNNELAYPWIVSGWYLTEIEDALTHAKMQLTYEVRDIVQNAGSDIIYDKEQNYSTILTKISVAKTPELKTITMPDGHAVTVNYGANRVDMNGARVISSIDIKYFTRSLSRYALNTSYFVLNRYGTPTTAYQKSVARLCLRSVKKIGPDLKDDESPYLFDYYTGSNNADDFVPPPFFYAKDIWGFYNGNESKSFNGTTNIALNTSITALSNDDLRGLCFLRNSTTDIVYNPKSGYAKNGLLKQIVYPAGGTLTYEYEQNYGKLNGVTERMVGGVHVSKTLSTDGGYSNPCGNPITTTYKYVESSGSASSLWGLELPITKSESSSYYDPEKKKYKFPASCDYKYKYPGILSQNQSINLSDWQQFMQVFSVVADIVSVVSLALDIITYIAAGTGIVGIIIAVIIMIGTAIWTCTKKMSETRNHVIHYNFDLTGFGGLPSQFRRVEVFEGNIGLAKTVTEFTSSSDYAIWSNTNPALAAMQRYAPWAYGLPKYVTVYDANGYKVKETYNNYNWAYAKRQLSSIKQSLKCFAKRLSSQRNVDWENPAFYNGAYYSASNSDILVQFYNFYSGRVLLDTTFERIFKPGSSSIYLETKTAYAYRDDYNYEPYKVSTLQSNGDRIDKTIKFQGDYSGTIMTNLANANMVTIPVATSFYVAKANGTSGYTGETVTEFTQLANGDIRPLKVLEQRLDRPAAITLYGGPGSALTNYKEAQSFTYDGSLGVITGIKDESNRSICNLWGYNNKFVIASVVNADVSSDKLSYTSFEDGWIGGWSVTGISYNTTQAVTGTTSLNISSPGVTLSYALGMAKPYILSLWSTTNTITVTGGVQTKSAPTVNGFTYYEYAIPAFTTTVGISGSGTIDELRLYPVSARMSTTTYDLILGKTSECDVNNRITYCEYDNLGRLRMIKDEKKNIVKMYEYNIISASQQNGCPATYYSKMVSETFTKNSCGSGYVGTDVVFTIPADKYSSTISQEDADLKAELDILTNGQDFANTNGSCKQIFYNTPQSTTIVCESCGIGYKGGNVTYTVPANRYSSLIDVADANDKALMDIEANAYAYANANPVCIVDNDPAWEEVEGNEYCLTINGALPAHQFMLFKDQNPNSSTYNQTQNIDLGVSDLCPANTYFNAQRSQAFTRNNCGTGFNGSSVTYTVLPGKYSSTLSQAAADQLAQNDIDANGQDYSNANGTCSTVQQLPITLKNVGATGNDHYYVYFVATGGTAYSTNFNNVSLVPGASYTKNVNAGTYDITIESKTANNVVFSLNGQLKTGTIVTYTNVSITNAFTIYAAAYQNTAQNVSYTRNNCPSGYSPTSVVYVVAAQVYTSLVSQADANTQAIAQTAAAGQAYANNNGLCNPPGPTTTNIIYTNTISRKVTLTLTNVATSVVYTFSLNAKTTGGTAGSVPAGYYNVKMHTNGPSDYYSIESYVQSIPDTDLMVNNIPLLMPTTTVVAN